MTYKATTLRLLLALGFVGMISAVSVSQIHLTGNSCPPTFGGTDANFTALPVCNLAAVQNLYNSLINTVETNSTTRRSQLNATCANITQNLTNAYNAALNQILA